MTTVVKLRASGIRRVLESKEGMTFPLDYFTESAGGGNVAHVRDYRYPGNRVSYQIWSLAPEDYDILKSEGPEHPDDHDESLYDIGKALVEDIASNIDHPALKGWSPTDCPSEVVGHLLNYIDEQAKPKPKPEPKPEPKPRKQFPVLNAGAKIDWQLVVDHGKQANANHSQTVERLAERGGLSWIELYYVLNDKPWPRSFTPDVTTTTAIANCRAIEARYLAAVVQPDIIAALRLAEGRLTMLMKADLPESDHPVATGYILNKVREALGVSTNV